MIVFIMHIPDRKSLYANFSSNIFPGSKLSKSDENMKISKHCKSSCTSCCTTIALKGIFTQSKDFVTVPQSHKVIIMKNYVTYPSFRFLRRSFD